MLLKLMLLNAYAQSSYVEFEEARVEGHVVKPSLTLISENFYDSCASVDKTTDEYIECKLNLSYTEIQTVCNKLSKGDNNILSYLDSIISRSKLLPIVETTSDGKWIYQIDESNKVKVKTAPITKYENTDVSRFEALAAVYELWSKQQYDLITMNSIFLDFNTQLSKNYTNHEDGSYYSVWDSCFTNGIEANTTKLVLEINPTSYEISTSKNRRQFFWLYPRNYRKRI